MRNIGFVVISLFAGCAGVGGADNTASIASVGAPASKIEHVVVVVQENHSFDNYYGTYCTAPTGSNPTCNDGPSCCEAAPTHDPGSGESAWTLSDTLNFVFDPNETQACQNQEIDGGKMDRYVTASCGHYANFAQAPASLVTQYRDWAGQYALADRYFQSVSGASSANDMYLSTARYMFGDDADEPNAIGSSCSTNHTLVSFTSTSLGDLLSAANVSWAWYAEGYATMKNSNSCPQAPPDCPAHVPAYPCIYDPSDIPAAYFTSSADQPEHMRDLGQLTSDLQAGTLPSVVFVKGLGYHTEHPLGSWISDGTKFVTDLVQQLQGSSAAASTLILLTYDEAGGWFDHVAPPPASTVDGQPYGARIPLLALGPFARRNFVSHAQMEHSSIVRFIEWNWLHATGQLAARDAVVNGLGSLLDSSATGVAVP